MTDLSLCYLFALCCAGISFPTCISVNNIVCHHSPLETDPDTCLTEGDLVKIELGAHIDGLIALVGHSMVVGASQDNVVTGRKADVMMAAHLASEAALRLFRPGNTNVQVTDKIVRIAGAFECRVRELLTQNDLHSPLSFPSACGGQDVSQP